MHLVRPSVSLALLFVTITIPFPRCTRAAALPFTFSRPDISDTCTRSTNTTHKTVPYFIRVTNKCADDNMTLCIEYQGAFHPMRTLRPGTSHIFPTQRQDCLAFAVPDCNGWHLFKHTIEGSRRFSVGCSAHDIQVQNEPALKDVAIDCTLTTVPLLDDLFDGIKAQFPTEALTDIHINDQYIFQDESGPDPVRYVTNEEFVKSVYTLTVTLLRHGADRKGSLTIIEHALALVFHTYRCRPFLVHDGKLGIPRPYFALYGIAAAHLQGQAEKNGTWKPVVSALTRDQKTLLAHLQGLATTVSVTTWLPRALIPPDELLADIGPPLNYSDLLVSRAVTREAHGLSTNASVRNSAYNDFIGKAENYCNAPGSIELVDFNKLSPDPGNHLSTWTFFRPDDSSLVRPIPPECCSSNCVWCDLAMRDSGFKLPGFLSSCCSSCNRGATFCGVASDNVRLGAVLSVGAIERETVGQEFDDTASNTVEIVL